MALLKVGFLQKGVLYRFNSAERSIRFCGEFSPLVLIEVTFSELCVLELFCVGVMLP